MLWFNSEAPARQSLAGVALYLYRKEKETHELILSWLSWLAVLPVGAYARLRRRATMAKELRKVAAILQLIQVDRDDAILS